jgi:Tfp pilus assembly protein PilF
MLPAELSSRFQSLVQARQVEQLIAELSAALPQHAAEADVHHLLGWARAQLGQITEAEHHFRQAIRLKPDASGSLNNLGSLLLDQERLPEALQTFKEAVQAQPTYVAALTNLSFTLARLNQFEHALPFLQEALRLEPNCPEAHHYLGYALMMLGQLAESEEHLLSAVRLQPQTAGFRSTLGLLRERQHRAEEATALFVEAIQMSPSLGEAWNNLGNIHAAVWGNWDFALQCFEKTLVLKPLYADAMHHRGMVQLSKGQFDRGWADYEYRPTYWQKSKERYSRPRWQGEPLAGKTILLHCEQGLGDTLQFIRYAQIVKALGASVLCEVQKALLPLLTRTPGIDSFIPEGGMLPPHDYQIPLLSLGKVLGVRQTGSYVFPEPARVALWQQRLAGIPGIKIGIAWQGESQFKYDWLRSIPLAEFAPLARLPGVTLISLQKHQGVEQIDPNRAIVPVTVLQPDIDTDAGPFMDTAAVMLHLDLIVTSDTSIAHLAGALGVPVWLATSFAPDWRWMIGSEDSPWYPSMRLFRQTKVGQWSDVFQRMASALSASNRPQP